MNITDDSDARKDIPLARGLLDYFPAALAEVARLSKAGNDKHNPGEEMHHARGKSNDHADCILRHLVDRGCEDSDGFLHDVKVAWRALAQLQEALEARGAKFARGARADAEYLEDLDDLRTIHERKDEPNFIFAIPPEGVVIEQPLFDPEWLARVNADLREAYTPEVDAYGRFVGEPAEPFTFTAEELDEMHNGLDPVADWSIVDAIERGEGAESVVDALYCANAISNRIAGDEHNKRTKNAYYKHDPTIIKGYCAECDKELRIDDECLVNNPGFDGSIMFCSLDCRIKLLKWQWRQR